MNSLESLFKTYGPQKDFLVEHTTLHPSSSRCKSMRKRERERELEAYPHFCWKSIKTEYLKKPHSPLIRFSSFYSRKWFQRRKKTFQYCLLWTFRTLSDEFEKLNNFNAHVLLGFVFLSFRGRVWKVVRKHRLFLKPIWKKIEVASMPVYNIRQLTLRNILSAT